MRKFVIGMLLMSLFVYGINNAATAAEPKILNAVSFLPKNHQLCEMIHVWIERVNEQCKDTIKIDWAGGGEIIPSFEQAEALRKNMVQLIFYPTAYYSELAPEINALSLSRLSIEEERKPGGLYDFMVERHKKIGMMYIGTWLYDPFYLRLAKPVKTLDELKGLKMRSGALYDPMMKELGMIPITIEFKETLESLNRGLVEGFGFATLGPAGWGWLDYCKYIIDIPIYTRQNTLILMNLDTWNNLPKNIQEKIMEITIEFEPQMIAHFKKKIAEEWKKYDEIGIKRITFTPAETQRYIDVAYESVWAELKTKVPNLVPDLKKLTGN